MLLEVGTTAAYTPQVALSERADELPRNAHLPTWLLETKDSGTLEARLIQPSPNPESLYAAQRSTTHDAHRQLNAEMETRVRELLLDALIARDPVSQASLSDFRSFIRNISFTRRPAIYLLDSGNFRAVWKNTDNEQAALQFRGNGIVQCVFFRKRAAPQLPLSTETLVDVIPKVRRRLVDFQHLLEG